jgi:probable HAF family extracellular repeat protein
MVDLGTFGPATDASAGAAVNSLGQVAGSSGNRAFLWKNDGGPMLDLGSLGGTGAQALALNDSGQVTGYAATNGTRIPHAFLWRNDGTPMVDLGPQRGKASYGRSINASGQVTGNAWAGRANNTTYYHAYLWRNDGTPPVDLDKTGGAHDSSGEKINDSGQVIGSAWSTTGDTYRAFTWKSNGTAVDLGTLGGTRSEAHDINRAGWVVGTSTRSPSDNSSYTAYLWIDNGQGIRNLNDLIDPADPLRPYVYLIDAFAINDAGDIAAVGNSSHIYILRGSQLALDPTSLTFGNQTVGTASAPRTVTVQNRTDSVVAITNIKLAGTGAKQFAYTSTCGNSVAGNGSCAIKVTFKPASRGAKSATLSVNGGGNGLRVANLSGKGT